MRTTKAKAILWLVCVAALVVAKGFFRHASRETPFEWPLILTLAGSVLIFGIVWLLLAKD